MLRNSITRYTLIYSSQQQEIWGESEILVCETENIFTVAR
uniref:Uncharacterized protein n=1 Tax=Octopus bimaculoides TaxID=37653 RepID=A0A0L8HLY8_OCTBM